MSLQCHSLNGHGDQERCLKSVKGQVSLLPPRRARRSTGNYTQVIVGKTVEKIFLEKISNHVKDKKVIRSCPHGFTKDLRLSGGKSIWSALSILGFPV